MAGASERERVKESSLEAAAAARQQQKQKKLQNQIEMNKYASK
jgi:hypothetical protein